MYESKNEKMKKYLRELEIIGNDIFLLGKKIRKLRDKMYEDELMDEVDLMNRTIESLDFIAEEIYEVEQSIKRKLEVK